MRSAKRIAWGWVAAGALGAALSALALLSVIFIGSNESAFESVFALAHYGLLPSIGIVALGAGALGALLALPAASPARIAHPALAVALITAFGPVDWIPWLQGGAKGIAQGALAVAILAAAIRYRRADARPGLIVGAALVAITLTPMAMYGAKSVETERKARWHFAAEERFASALERRAEEAAPHAHALPDLYVIILEQHPSPRAAEERGLGYDEAALDALRARGWRVSNDAQTNAPQTDTSFATMLSLSERLTDGTQTKRVDAAALNAHVSAGEIALSRAFAAPLALDVLGHAEYRREAWVGWWLPTMTLRVDAIDLYHARGGAAHLWGYLRGVWRREHGWARSEGTATTSLDKLINAALRTRCDRFVGQRERLFAKRDREGDGPRFLLYHTFWLHDRVPLDSEGSCTTENALPALEAKGCPGWFVYCVAGEERARRIRASLAYLPQFLERIERHARRYARGRAFRILAFADEGYFEDWSDEEEGAGNAAWRHEGWRKHRAVWRASFTEGAPELWEEEEIPDLPRALKESIEDAFDTPVRSATMMQSARGARDH